MISNKPFLILNYQSNMIKILFLILLIFFLEACKQNKPISYGPYQALSCESKDKELFNKYIFNKKNGYLYFYEKKTDEFIPLNLRFEAGFFSENITELSSRLRNKKLIITDIDYGNNSSKLYRKIKHIIDLRKLVKTTIKRQSKEDFIAFEGKCHWIDPKLGIKY